jgi:hypothetical protein
MYMLYNGICGLLCCSRKVFINSVAVTKLSIRPMGEVQKLLGRVFAQMECAARFVLVK